MRDSPCGRLEDADIGETGIAVSAFGQRILQEGLNSGFEDELPMLLGPMQTSRMVTLLLCPGHGPRHGA